MADQTNAQYLYDQLVNRIGGAISGVAGGLNTASRNAALGGAQAAPAPAPAPAPAATAPAAPAAPRVDPRVLQQLDRQDQARSFVAGLPAYAPPAAAPAVPAPAPVQRAAPAGGGTAPAAAARPAGNGLPNGIINPSDAITTGIGQQLSYQRSALDAILNAARQGDPRNYSFRLAHLVGAMGSNNFAGVQGQGVDVVNQALAGMHNADVGANAQITSAGISAGAQNAMTNALMERFYASPMQVGGEGQYISGPNGEQVFMGTLPTYGVPTRGGGFSMVNPQGTRSTKPVEGTRFTFKDGVTRTYKNGQWVQ